MHTLEDIRMWRGMTAVDTDGNKVGKIDEVYLDRDSGEPEWVTVNTGLFGTRTSFAPISGARQVDDQIRLSYSKDQIKDAPGIDPDGQLSTEEENILFDHYGRAHAHEDDSTGHDMSGPDTDGAMTRSEEELRVGTERREAGRGRLRKYVVTEEVSKTVPVQREELRVEREPITDANRDAALDGPAISEEEHEVVLHEEVPVVEKRAVPRERVRLEKETRTDEETVTDEVRKERIDTEGDAR